MKARRLAPYRPRARVKDSDVIMWIGIITMGLSSVMLAAAIIIQS